MDYGQVNVVSTSPGKSAYGMSIDKTCKLLKSAQPLVWAVAIVFGVLGVTLTIRFLWRKKTSSPDELNTSDNGVASWISSRGF
jgi:hypothetical protein